MLDEDDERYVLWEAIPFRSSRRGVRILCSFSKVSYDWIMCGVIFYDVGCTVRRITITIGVCDLKIMR